MYFLKAFKRGIFNRYRKGMPIAEMAYKDFQRFLLKTQQWIGLKPRIRILCYPHLPSRGATIYRIARLGGFEITNLPSGKFNAVVYWEYATVRKEFEFLEQLGAPVLNLQSRDIGKQYVDSVMKEVFGYSAAIDPVNYRGVAVEKSNINAVHDGRIIECPHPRVEGMFYMKLVDSAVNDTEVMDVRTPIMGNEIPHVYLAYRSAEARFVNVPPRVELEVDVDKVYTPKEREQLLGLARALGLDYGEMDVLRDKTDGRIYVVDVNNTPQGPPKNLTKSQKKAAIRRLHDSFVRQFLTSSSSNVEL
ncbi:MAG: hypothetical protein Kow0075_09840 [Salibacteraceae bacterium]